MAASTFTFPLRDEFLNREADLARLEDWWAGTDRNALALYGRRRVGKSWLFRAFADQKPALILVAERRATGAQLERFAAALETPLGLLPDLPDLATLIRVLYRNLGARKSLVVIDEFPYLLPTRKQDRHDVLTSVQAVMEEERDQSNLKLVLCGSHIHQMEMLLSEASPVRGRLTPMRVAPMTFAESQAFFSPSGAEKRIERYAVTGGMALFLSELGGRSTLADAIKQRVLDHRGPLFNDPREVLEEEFTKPGVRFSLLEELAGGECALADLAGALKTSTQSLTAYLDELEEMELIRKLTPMGSGRGENRYRLNDYFLRFWFRFVFPAQDDLSSGLQADSYWANEIAPLMPEHVAPVFEDLCREYVRRTEGVQVGSWWGHALNEHRKSGARSSEEIDLVGVQGRRVTCVGECKWTSGKMTIKILDDLETFKIPALRQDGARIRQDLKILLFSKAGYKQNLIDGASDRADITLVDLDELDRGLLA